MSEWNLYDISNLTQDIKRIYCVTLNELSILEEYRQLGEIKELKSLKDDWHTMLISLEKCRKFMGDEKFLEVTSER